VPTALSQGVIDAVEPVANAWLASKLYEIANHVTRIGYVLDFYIVCTNKVWWDRMPAATRDAARSVGDVRGDTEASGEAAERVLAAASGVADESKLLQSEVTRFVELVRSSTERRRYDRHPCDLAIELRSALGTAPGRITNISFGGALVDTPMDWPVGTEVMLKVRAVPDELPARVARHLGGRIVVVFRQDDATEQALRRIVPNTEAMAA
jgi:hypothetical protein